MKVVAGVLGLFAPLALKLHFYLEVSALGCCLMRSSPERPGDDVGGLDASLGQFCGDAADFLDRPADPWRTLRRIF